MLTLFAIPKAFRGEFDVIQRNAIQSWAQLQPACEIVLAGDDGGTREMAEEVGAIHIPDVGRNEFGTPLLDSLFREVERHASFPFLCYVNADIILLDDFVPAFRDITSWNSRALIVGRRFDLSYSEPLVFTTLWEQRLRTIACNRGVCHTNAGLDYFGFPRGSWGSLPPFAIGRGLWDNWLLYRARSLGMSVVDATERINAIHQNHGYTHHPEGEAGVWQGLEAKRNWDLGGGLRNAYTLADATHLLTVRGIKRRPVPFDLHRILVQPFTTSRFGRPLVRAARAISQTLYASLHPGAMQ